MPLATMPSRASSAGYTLWMVSRERPSPRSVNVIDSSATTSG